MQHKGHSFKPSAFRCSEHSLARRGSPSPLPLLSSRRPAPHRRAGQATASSERDASHADAMDSSDGRRPDQWPDMLRTVCSGFFVGDSTHGTSTTLCTLICHMHPCKILYSTSLPSIPSVHSRSTPFRILAEYSSYTGRAHWYTIPHTLATAIRSPSSRGQYLSSCPS